MSISQKLGGWVGGQGRWHGSCLVQSMRISVTHGFWSVSKDGPIAGRVLHLFALLSSQGRRGRTSLIEMNLSLVTSLKNHLAKKITHVSTDDIFFHGFWFVLHMFRGPLKCFYSLKAPTVRKWAPVPFVFITIPAKGGLSVTLLLCFLLWGEKLKQIMLCEHEVFLSHIFFFFF